VCEFFSHSFVHTATSVASELESAFRCVVLALFFLSPAGCLPLFRGRATLGTASSSEAAVAAS